MSLSAFAVLSRKHPERLIVLRGLENQLRETLARNENAVIDDRVLVTHMLAWNEAIVKETLVELVGLSSLRTLLLWQCPNGFGTAAEANRLSEFQESIDCDRCGATHRFNADDVEVRYESTERLRRELGL